MASISFTNGFLVLIEGDKTDKTEWFKAHKWQEDEFFKVMCFGSMKSMGYPKPIEQTEPFFRNGYKYRFIIENDWGPVTLENMTTGKKRAIQYLEIGKTLKEIDDSDREDGDDSYATPIRSKMKIGK